MSEACGGNQLDDGEIEAHLSLVFLYLIIR